MRLKIKAISDLIGRTLGHYRIVEIMGAGGMNEVYRAHDPRLDREVAIKVLPESVVRDADRVARFEREARALAKLAHPNILEIWDTGTEDGVSYAVMELLEGSTLRRAIPADGISWQRAVEIGAAIADGLAAASIIAARRVAKDEEMAVALEEGFAEGGYPLFLEKMMRFFRNLDRVQPSSVAMLYARLGDLEAAFEWLEKGFEMRTRSMVNINVEPQFDNLRSDPRFLDILRRMNFPDGD